MIEHEMRDLEERINYHRNLYYNEHRSEISDKKFDEMFDRLLELESENPELANPESPTRIVGADSDNSFEKTKHSIPVLSLENTYSPEEAVKWLDKIGNPECLVEWKIDGASLVLYYKNGVLDKAVTRGDGKIGDDVTANALRIKDIPRKLKQPITCAIRGEVFMTFEAFKKLNEASGGIYANPRNLASGSLKHKHPAEVAKRNLSFIAYEGEFEVQDQPKSGMLTYGLMGILGLPTFKTLESMVISQNDFMKSYNFFEEERKKLNYPVDGLVIKINDIQTRKNYGFKTSVPKWAIALKFQAEEAETIVEDIIVQVGRTGKITPKAKLTPVQLAGTIVQFATLHNETYIKQLHVRIGSKVIVSKRGEIIPAVERVTEVGNGPEYKFPDTCPSCGSFLSKEDYDSVDWICKDDDCDEKKIQRIIFFASKSYMDIEGLGESTVRDLYEKLLLDGIVDIYELHHKREQMLQIERFGFRKIEKLLEGIEASKEKPFEKVLPALGIKDVGNHTTKILIENGYDNIDKILELVNKPSAYSILSNMEGIGSKTANGIINSLKDFYSDNINLIMKLEKYDLQFEIYDNKDKEMGNSMEGQIWCVTGSFENFKPRDKAMDEVKARGGQVSSSVSKKLTHLLVGEKAGSKLKKAQDLGIIIVNEEEFMEMLK